MIEFVDSKSSTPESNSNASASVEESVIEGGEISGINENTIRIDPLRQHKADTTRKLAFGLVAMLSVSILIHYAMITWLLMNNRVEALEALNTIFTTWLPVASGLTGSAVTFFFTREK